MTGSLPVLNPSGNDPRPFIDREREIVWVQDQLAQDRHLLILHGAPRIGKTILLRELARRLADHYLTTYLNAGSAIQADAGPPLWQVAQAVARQVESQLCDAPEPPGAEAFVDDPVQAWQTYLRALTTQPEHKRLVLLIDQADRAGSSWLHRLLQARSALVLGTESRQHLAEALPQAEAAPGIIVGLFEHAPAEELVKALIAPHAKIDPWAVRRIVGLASNHPYYIRLLCNAVLDCCGYRSPLGASEVEQALALLLEAPIEELTSMWESLDARQQYVLAAFCALIGYGGIATDYEVQKSCTRHGYALSGRDVAAALEALVERGVLEKLGANSYRFTLELFRLWVNHHHTPEGVLRDGPRPYRRALIPGPLRRLRHAWAGYWPLWIGIAAVASVILLQSLLWQNPSDPVPTPTYAELSSTSTPSPKASPSAQGTRHSNPGVPLPDYDVAFMYRADPDALWQIYLTSTRTGDRLRLTDTDANERTPRWAPDGTRLAFVSERDGDREIYLADLTKLGTEGTIASPLNLTQHPAQDWQPAWSPTDDRIAFSSHRDGNWEIYVMHADGTGLVRLTEDPESDFSPAWSPDGSKLVFASRRRGDADLFIIDLEGGQEMQLTHGELNEYDPAWSPDGKWIAFVTQMADQSDLFMIRAEGTDPVNLTDSPYANEFQPAWSPDSEWLLFVSYTTVEGDHEILRIPRAGGEMVKVTDDPGDDLAPSWRPARP